MGKQLSPLLVILLGIISGLLSGCQSRFVQTATSTISLTPTLSRTLTSTPTPTKTATATVTPTFTPTYTPTPVPIYFDIFPTTLQQSGEWHITLPFSDPSYPELITASSEGYRLDPVFEVNSIDLSYEWWGLGDPVLDYQRIERRSTRFWRGDTAISAESVKALVRSIDHLSPQPLMVNTITHTDDYPIWAIEITSVEGNHILLYSNSNGNNYAPWNVICNGQIYSQFTGEIAIALSKLFEVSEGQPMAWTSEGGSEEGYLIVDTTGWPGQLSNGFSGLLAVQSGFNYWPDSQKGELHGYLQGRASIGGMGNMIIGSITDLQEIELEVNNSQTVACTLNVLPSDDPAASTWEFVCPVGSPITQSDYHYPIKVTFSTDQDKTYTVSGELFGHWEQGTVLPAIRYPEEIGEILDRSPVVQDLLTDHQMIVLEFNAAVDPTTSLMDHRWTADVALLGQAKIGSRILPYTVTVKAEIKDKELVHWDLDRTKLQTLLHDVLNQAITRHFLEGDPNLVLNLYYVEGVDYQIVSDMYLKVCADLPVADGLPNAEQPLIGFAFNQSWGFDGIQIVIMNDQVRIINLDIYPSSPNDAIWTSLLPIELQPQDAPPFSEISLWPWSPIVAISWDQNVSTKDIDTYKALAQTWPGEKDVESWGVMIDAGMFDITADGRLALIACNAP